MNKENFITFIYMIRIVAAIIFFIIMIQNGIIHDYYITYSAFDRFSYIVTSTVAGINLGSIWKRKL